jgi:hypothetical protein
MAHIDRAVAVIVNGSGGVAKGAGVDQERDRQMQAIGSSCAGDDPLLALVSQDGIEQWPGFVVREASLLPRFEAEDGALRRRFEVRS